MSSSNSAFNLQGAIQPNPNAINPLKLGQSLGGTPANNALTSAQGLIAPKINFPAPVAPSTPLKQTVVAHPDGTSVTSTYHAPATNTESKTSSNTGTTSGLLSSTTLSQDQQKSSNQGKPGYDALGNPINPPAPTSTSTTQPNPTDLTGVVSGLTNIGTNGSQGYTDAINAQNQLKQGIAKEFGNIENGGYLPMDFVGGREQSLKNQYASQLDAAQQAVNQQQTQQGQQIGALGSAAGILSPRQNGYVLINPTTGQPVGGTGGAIGAVTSGANIGSAQDFQTQINNIQAAAPAADSAFNVLNNYAKQVGGGDTPILKGLQQILGTTVQGSQAVAAFQAQLQAVAQAWTAIEGTPPPDWTNITANQLVSIQNQLKQDVKNKIAGFQSQINNLAGGQTGTTGGSANDPLNLGI